MVQVLPQPYPTFGQQIASGMERGAEAGQRFSEAFLKHGLEQKSKQAEIARKLQGLQRLKDSPYWEGASDLEKAILESEIMGDITGQTSKSLINLQREAQGRDWIQDRMRQIGQRRPEGIDQGREVEGLPQDGMGRFAPAMGEPSQAELDELIAGSALPGAMGEFYKNELQLALERRKEAQLPKQEFAKHSAAENAKYLERIGQLEDDLPSTEVALAGIEDALGNAGKWAAFRDQIAEKTGFEGARSAAGAELDSFIKNYFLGDLTSIKGGRANVFLEKQIRDAYPRAGRDPIANQKVVVGMHLKEALHRMEVEKAREMEKNYLNKLGYLPSGFKSQVKDAIRKEASALEKQAVDTIHNLSEIEKQRDKLFRKYVKEGEILMMGPEGQPFAVPQKEERAYREQGYIPLGKK